MQEKVAYYNKQIENKSAQEIVSYCIHEFGEKIALANSMGAEDQVLTDMICKEDKTVKIFTLDTGRIFPETYSLIAKTNLKYDIRIQVYFPDHKKVEEIVNKKGVNLFYDSIENRKECCYIRKIEPLQRAFKGLDAWICGLRREQSVTRTEVQPVEWDVNNQLLKINPLYRWSEKEVWDYIHAHQIPYNLLHDKGFASIGCQPCTRAVKEGEDVRAGRWWWEDPENKECGLHAR